MIITTNAISKITEQGLNRLWEANGGVDACLSIAQRMELVSDTMVRISDDETDSKQQWNSFKLFPVSLDKFSSNHVPPCAAQLQIAGPKSICIR
jgi:hypothetical protein